MIRRKDLYTALADSAFRFPDKIALVEAGTGKKVSYHELLMQVDRAADMFFEHGIRKGDRVAVAHRNSINTVVANFGLYKLGAVCIPMNFMVTKPEEIEYILNNAEAKAVVTQAEFIRHYVKCLPQLPTVKYIFTTDEIPSSAAECPIVQKFWEEIEKSTFHDETASAQAGLDDLAFILYTSGTTGLPKGAMLTHGNLASNVISCAQIFKINDNDCFLCLLPMFHSFAWTACVVIPLYLNLKVVIVANVMPASKWLGAMGTEKVTLILAVPQIYAVLSKEAKGLKRLYLRFWPFKNVRFGVSGAAPLTQEIKDRFEEKIGVPILEGYGLTETSPVVSVNTEELQKIKSVGPAIPAVSTLVLDDDGKEVPRNAEGELCVKGPNVFRGYWGNEKATHDAFTEDGWFKTGDIVTVDDDGFIFIKDRKKDMIIIKGLKVFSAQVEAVICEHPAVEECAVIGVPDGRGGEFVKVYVVKKEGAELSDGEFRKFLKTHLDNYKRPRDFEFVESLPKNALRKVLKRELRKDAVAKLAARGAGASAEDSLA
ncbi:class I adenylate-forming enzyme family protein [Candidatus Avelusimicrobium fimicolum]|jgi:long-chain acyl-CoA synthetase|uniref:class I adenylate-forming enzyme family protein n=1 Tax=Candidatus Avelusimicrobium fimicolum TaxID=3416216 RepID=UPI003D0B74EE